MTAIFKREVRSSFHGMIGYVLTAFMLAATAIYFVALNLGYGLTDFGYYYALPHHVCAAFVYPGAHHALLCRGTPHPHRSAAAHQPGVCVGIVLGKFFGPVRHLCTAVPCRCGHDPCTGRTGCHRHGHAGKLGRSAVLLSHGLRRHCHWRVSFQPDRESDHCCGGRCCRTAAGLHDAQPAQHVSPPAAQWRWPCSPPLRQCSVWWQACVPAALRWAA